MTLQNISHQALLIILKLSIEHGNCIIGAKSWESIIKLIYRRDHDEPSKFAVSAQQGKSP